MAWIRLHTDILDDIQKTRKLSANSYQIFTFLLLYAKELESNGEVNLPLEDVQWRLRVDMQILKTAVDDLKHIGILSNKHSGIKFTNWAKRQYSESYERVKKHREKKRYSNGESNADETMLQNRTETETEQNRTENTKTTSVSRDKITFDRSSGKFLNISDEHLDLWREAYPAIDLQVEIGKAAAWLHANPKNSKSNYERFLANWFSRAQDRAPRTGTANGSSNIPKDSSWTEYCDIKAYRKAKAEGKKNITLSWELKHKYPEEV